jgi:hypothetical protein
MPIPVPTDLEALSLVNTRRRTLLQTVQDVIRETRGQTTLYEARQAVQDAVNAIDASANWEFLLATRLINLHAPNTTGTVSVNSGTAVVTLTGGSWPVNVSPFGEYREIKFSDRGLPYKVASMDTTTQATLKTSVSGTALNHIVNGAYALFQARYPLPVDCEPGRDLTLKGSYQYGNIPKRERMTYDHRSSSLTGASWPQYYTDDEYDDTNGSGTIRLEPYPSTAVEIQLTYYRKMIVPSASDSLLMIPEAFERAPILAAAANILRRKNMQGWQQMRQEAGDLLNKMYNRYAASAAYEGKIQPSFSDMFDDGDTQIFGADSQMLVREGF